MARSIPHSPPPANAFYQRVMSYPSSGNKLKPAKIKPKPTYKKDAKVKKAAGKLKALLKVSKTGHTGDFSEKKRAFFKNHLKNLSREQVDRLKKKIDHIAKDLMSGSNEEKEFKHLQHLVKETVTPLLRTSVEYVNDLILRIQERLEEFPNLKLIYDGNNHHEIRLNRKKLPILSFAREYFSDLIEEYKSLVAQGAIIPSHGEKRGSSFVIHVIINSFE